MSGGMRAVMRVARGGEATPSTQLAIGHDHVPSRHFHEWCFVYRDALCSSIAFRRIADESVVR